MMEGELHYKRSCCTKVKKMKKNKNDSTKFYIIYRVCTCGKVDWSSSIVDIEYYDELVRKCGTDGIEYGHDTRCCYKTQPIQNGFKFVLHCSCGQKRTK